MRQPIDTNAMMNNMDTAVEYVKNKWPRTHNIAKIRPELLHLGLDYFVYHRLYISDNQTDETITHTVLDFLEANWHILCQRTMKNTYIDITCQQFRYEYPHIHRHFRVHSDAFEPHYYVCIGDRIIINIKYDDSFMKNLERELAITHGSRQALAILPQPIMEAISEYL